MQLNSWNHNQGSKSKSLYFGKIRTEIPKAIILSLDLSISHTCHCPIPITTAGAICSVVEGDCHRHPKPTGGHIRWKSSKTNNNAKNVRTQSNWRKHSEHQIMCLQHFEYFEHSEHQTMCWWTFWTLWTFLTPDNVPVNIDGVLFLHITDTYKASYEVRFKSLF